MSDADRPSGAPAFEALTPDAILGAVEKALGKRTSGVCRPLNSYINRVAEVGLAGEPPVIAKFYRPGRWSADALRDEQEFLLDLAAEEIPVAAPLPGADGRTLHDLDGFHFALFPKFGGRICDEPAPDEWRPIGRLLARVHAVGARRAPRDRIRLHPGESSALHLDYILRFGGIPPRLAGRFEREVRGLLGELAPRFEGIEAHRIHGDFHRGNLLRRPDEPFVVMDFDDMATGPAVQDLWMLLPDRPRLARRELDALIEGYGMFRDFPARQLGLIEPLRAMRFLHYTAWCARQRADGGFHRLAPGWGAPDFWRRELDDWARQRLEIEESLGDAEDGP